MKIKKLFLGALIALLPISIAGVSAKTLNHPSEYYNPKYYDIKAPSDYYNRVNTALTGEDFRNNLFLTISDGHTPIEYHDNNEIIRYTDPDPLQTKPGNVIGLYSGESLEVREKDWNKEHVWAKSHGFPSSNSLPHGDAHHLRPAIPSINSKRSNHDFGENNANPDAYGNRCDGKVFEPRDEAKGDVARMMFYMATRYGSMTSFNLRLVESRTTGGSSASFGGLKDLIKWHYEDPVSKEEIYRNNIIFEFYQHNRNPYIDHPEWVDLAYPSEFANQEVDEAKVNKVIELIKTIPTNVTLADKDLVFNAKKEYDKLNYKEKEGVTNYSILEAAVNKINSLEKPNPEPDPNPDKPIIPSDSDIAIDLSATGLSNQSYTAGLEFKAGDYNFYASRALVNGGVIRLGSNDNDLLTKFNLNEDGAYLEIKEDFKNLKSIRVNINQTYSGYNGWKLYFRPANSEAIELINEGNSGNAEASLASPRDGHFILVIIGSKARADLGTYSLNMEKAADPLDDKAKAFINEKTDASLRVRISTKEADMDLRFGSRIKRESFNENAKYGVLVLEGNKTLNSGLQKEASIKDITSNKYLEITPVRVNSNGDIAEDGEYYQFAWVITNMEGHYDFMFNAVIYMEVDGKLYFAKPVKASLKQTAKYYLDNNLVDDLIVKAELEKLFS